ncbi:unnamed protein product [Larinioides sclopetarius]|uniref:Uncharacterized protein n=2 Tax=Araneidae TaxID=6913 RepID=A0AAV1ZL46_9ARAC
MWASRPSYYDNDMPIDLRKKVVLQREQEESRKKEPVFTPKENLVNHNHSAERWHPLATALPVSGLYPFMSERYGVRCSVVTSQDENRSYDAKYGSRGSLETAIQKLHHNRQLKKSPEPPREERCRSTDILEKREKDGSLESKRSNSCPNLTTIIKPKPSPLKPKSSFILRSSEYLAKSESNTNSFSGSYHSESDDHSNHMIGGARKRKSFIPVYGDRAPSPKRKPISPTEHSPYEEYFPHPEILLRRQLQQHGPAPYVLQVYDYYQQLVQRLRDHSSPGVVHLPPPASPNSMDEEMPSDPQRRRPCRALTGKHVRQGTGASLSTLLTLRQKIEERQRAKEHHPLNVLNGSCKSMSPKRMKVQKTKSSPKNLLNKI